MAAALITGVLVVSETNRFPRTDDAEIFANFIGMAPQVDGPIAQLAVQDNAFIKQGELLFEIDPGLMNTPWKRQSRTRRCWRGRSATSGARSPRR